mmetsp:Transcript_83979/g.224669  ORF Transcript_83979/g.224669 Transcript_83979/m.224669 type:complete len:249 (+) Transcript_83979:1117-1863(+)
MLQQLVWPKSNFEQLDQPKKGNGAKRLTLLQIGPIKLHQLILQHNSFPVVRSPFAPQQSTSCSTLQPAALSHLMKPPNQRSIPWLSGSRLSRGGNDLPKQSKPLLTRFWQCGTIVQCSRVVSLAQQQREHFLINNFQRIAEPLLRQGQQRLWLLNFPPLLGALALVFFGRLRDSRHQRATYHFLAEQTHRVLFEAVPPVSCRIGAHVQVDPLAPHNFHALAEAHFQNVGLPIVLEESPLLPKCLFDVP